MSDLISREEAIDSLTEIIMNLKNLYGDMGSAVNGARECIKSLPSAEPERTAKVECRKWRKDLTLIGGGSWSGKCQGCGRWVKSNECTYCPSCGAKLAWSNDE